MLGFAVIRRNRRRPGFEDLHRQRKRGQSPGAVVDLDALQIMGQDQRGDLGGVETLFLLDRVQQVEGMGQHMSRAAGGIANTDVFGAFDAQKIRLGLDRRD